MDHPVGAIIAIALLVGLCYLIYAKVKGKPPFTGPNKDLHL